MVFDMIAIFEDNEDKEKFCYLYEKANSIIYKRVYGILRNSQDTEDALQETWEKVMKNFDKIKDQSYGKAMGFINIVAKNTAIDNYNKRKRLINIEDYDTVICVSKEYVENEVISKLASDDIMEVINSVSDNYKNPLILKYIYNCSNKEIAEILNITESNVATRLARARKAVKERLIKRDDEYEKS